MVNLVGELTNFLAQLLACSSIVNLAPNTPYTLSSEGYPNDYFGLGWSGCKINFDAPAGHVVRATCNVELPFSRDCSEDGLVFSALGNPDERYCGTNPHLAVSSKQNSMSVELVASLFSTGRFTCEVEAVPEVPPCVPTTTNVAATSGVRHTSPDYPANYDGLLASSCKHNFIGPVGTVLLADCNVELPSSTDCSGDRLVLSGLGYTTDSTKYCGNAGYIRIYSSANTMTLEFTTVPSSTTGRFSCYISARTNQCSACTRSSTMWNVEVVSKSNPEVRCPGNFISSVNVVTEAKCVYQRPVEDLLVMVPNGANTLNYVVASVTMSPAFTPNVDNEYALALVKIRDSLPGSLQNRLVGACSYGLENLGWLEPNMIRYCPIQS